MKYFSAITLVLFFLMTANAQIYVAGDTTGKYVYSVEQWFGDVSVNIDIDCKDSTDLNIDSYLGGHFSHDWGRLSLRYPDSVTVARQNDTAWLGLFREGDTIPLGNNIWTRNIDFIYGYGAMGPYGVNIDTSYLAFRKIDNSDTSYVFVLATSPGTTIYIHKIISECPLYPVQVISSTGEISSSSIAYVHPNPFFTQLTFSLADNVPTTISLYNFLGQQVLQQTFTNSATINTRQLADGIYFYELKSNKGTLKTGKVVKQ